MINRTKSSQYLKNVVSLSLDDKKCTGCGRCEEVCPHRVFELSVSFPKAPMSRGFAPMKKARLTNRDLCMECGACALNCPAKAISVNPGVGCAAAIIWGWLTGKEPACGCGEGACCG